MSCFEGRGREWMLWLCFRERSRPCRSQSRSDGHGSETDRQSRNPQVTPEGFALRTSGLVNAPERRLWASNAKISRARVCPALRMNFLQSSRSRVRVRLMAAAFIRPGSDGSNKL